VRQLDLQARFDAALGAVPEDLRTGPIGLAVSGGSDSRALLHLARDWAAARGRTLRVLTIDHRLRPEAADEAASIATLCHTLGLEHQTLAWNAPVPRQAAARRARHALLATALRAAGGQLLLTGHTADDQAETVLMRARQGSGWYGLAGMRRLSLSPVWPEGDGIWIARPLLGETRAALRSFLTGQGADWIDDPSNANAAFERVRVRRRLGSPGTAARVLACQKGFARLRAVEDAFLARCMGTQVSALPDGSVVTRLAGLPPERAARALGVLIQCTGGRETPPRSESLAGLAARLSDPSGFRGATLGGVRLRPRKAGLVLSAEPANHQISLDPARVGPRITGMMRLFINSAQEMTPCS
jgi:tRNA(Ile)-lysidine synthase